MVICTYGIPTTSRLSNPLRSLSCQVQFASVLTAVLVADGCFFHWDLLSLLLIELLPFDVVRTAKFVARKQWIVCGSDDMFVRVYNYNTMDKVKSFEAHTDYIRSIAVHPTQPYLLTCSDDMLIKLWDWDKVCTYLLSSKGLLCYACLSSALYIWCYCAVFCSWL